MQIKSYVVNGKKDELNGDEDEKERALDREILDLELVIEDLEPE